MTIPMIIKTSSSDKVMKRVIKLFGKEKHNFTVGGNHEYKETESITFVQSSLIKLRLISTWWYSTDKVD